MLKAHASITQETLFLFLFFYLAAASFITCWSAGDEDNPASAHTEQIKLSRAKSIPALVAVRICTADHVTSSKLPAVDQQQRTMQNC